ncbi:MAG: hypothetical protein AAFO94_21670, partial [Bacteroidota bacterium]
MYRSYYHFIRVGISGLTFLLINCFLPCGGQLMAQCEDIGSATVENCYNGIDDDGDGLVDAFDSDCPCDFTSNFGVCAPDCQYDYPPNIFNVEKEWTSEEWMVNLPPMVAGDLDGDTDGASEIVAILAPRYDWSEQNLIVILDGITGEIKYYFASYDIDGFNKGIAIADADEDGRGEIYYMTGSSAGSDSRKIVCYEYNPYGTNLYGHGTGNFEFQWISNNRVTCGLTGDDRDVIHEFAVNVADFDSDGTPEVYTCNEVFNALTGARIATGGSNSIGTFMYDWDVQSDHPVAYPVAMDVLDDSACSDCCGLELVAGNQVYSLDVG